ncbi:MAG: diaminopimelate dehydrogenase [Oscillospiraceae bacterium]|nr:diaminopimelate dehydrogenase [Oscillospiraceae bacterium]
MESIRIGILGYGNIGRGVELAVRQNPDMSLVGVFTRRKPERITTCFPETPVYHTDSLLDFTQNIDVLILGGGSATDLPEQSPRYARQFHIVDSFDTHSRIPEHFDACDAAAKETSHVALISTGWDPGMFSLQRLLAGCILPEGQDYTFWGKGVSQGHSDAIRRIDGVVDARQYTIPVEEALRSVRAGENPTLTTRQKHTRECYVVAAEGADRERIENQIVTMPGYFADYDTTVYFITQEELDRDHRGIPHGGFVIRTGVTGAERETRQCIEYSLHLDSNPEFTSSVLVAYARAVHRLAREGQWGAKTVFDIPPAYLSPKTGAQLRQQLL